MKLFVIEGLDGAGKSTQIQLLKEFFLKQGYICEYLHYPRTEAPYFGELIARFLRGEFGEIGDVDPYLVAMLYAGDRKDASELISGWLKKGNIVILDRYTYSNIAYQCAKLADPGRAGQLMVSCPDPRVSDFRGSGGLFPHGGDLTVQGGFVDSGAV